MDAGQLRAFLDRPLVAVVATVRKNGSPHAVPVWFRYDGEALHVWTDTARAWVRNIAREPSVTVCVAESGPPFAAAVIRGRATILSDDTHEVSDEIHRVVERYMPSDDIDAYIESWRSLRTIVTVHLEHVTSWDRGY